jgi:signal transduction histidine kinase
MQGGRGAVLAFIDITERLASEKAIRERDAAEIRAAESQAAQRRILESATVARHQVARDLHDGAQQRLVTLVLGLQLARDQIRCPREDRSLLNKAMEQTGGGHSPTHPVEPRTLRGRQGLSPAFGAPCDRLRSHTRPTARGRRGQCVFPDR